MVTTLNHSVICIVEDDCICGIDTRDECCGGLDIDPNLPCSDCPNCSDE